LCTLSYLQVFISMKFFSFSIPILLLLSSSVFAQQNPGDVVVDIRLMEAVTKAQVISLSTLGIDVRGRGQRVMELVLQNRLDQTVKDLYFHVTVSSSNVGLVAEVDSKPDTPFSLRPNQLMITDNNRLYDGLPEIPELVGFVGDLTPQGKTFIESLDGATRLPDAVYTVVVSIYQGSNRPNGGRMISTVTQSVGSQPITNTIDFNLLTPGGPLGSNELIASAQPSFRWDGPSNTEYRLILVQDLGRGQSPEALIQAAVSTEPTSGQASVGTLLEFEMLDVILNSNNYFYPAAGVKRLQPGNKFYWQVIARIRTSRGTDNRPSAIYEFTLSNPQAAQQAEMQSATVPLASTISPEVAAAIQNLVQNGFKMDKMVIDGRELSGTALQAFLEDFVEKIKRGEIIIVKQ
jgi:hypothetical protein